MRGAANQRIYIMYIVLAERPAVSMSFLFSLDRKAAKMLAMQAASRAHTEKSAEGGGAEGGQRVGGRPKSGVSGRRRSQVVIRWSGWWA